MENSKLAIVSSMAVLVEFKRSTWTATKKDKRASSDVSSSYFTSPGVASVSKSVLEGCDELDAIKKYGSLIYNQHRTMTLPWSLTGSRLLPITRLVNYENLITTFSAEFDVLVEQFLNAYDWQVEKAQERLGDLYDPNDYPFREVVEKNSLLMSITSQCQTRHTGLIW